MVPVIELVTTRGSLWRVPASIACDDRATYYSKKENGVYKEEYEFCMHHDDEIIDWARNNMNWEDVSKHARLIDTAEEDMSYEWGAGDMEVIEQAGSD